MKCPTCNKEAHIFNNRTEVKNNKAFSVRDVKCVNKDFNGKPCAKYETVIKTLRDQI